MRHRPGDELVITLGTGFGSVLFVQGHRIHLELGHHPFHEGKTYEDELGNRAFLKKGKKKWNKYLREAIDELSRAFNYDRLYIGGGNAAAINFKLPENVKVISNMDGLLGGIKLWQHRTRREEMTLIAIDLLTSTAMPYIIANAYSRRDTVLSG